MPDQEQNRNFPERLADRVQSPMAKFLVEFDQRVAELDQRNSSEDVREACRSSLGIDAEAARIHEFAVRSHFDEITDSETLSQRDFSLFQQLSDEIRAGDGEAVFQQAREFVAIRRSSLPHEARRYVFLQSALEKRGKTLAELSTQELLKLDEEMLYSEGMEEMFPYPSQFLFGSMDPNQTLDERIQSHQFPDFATVKVSNEKLAALTAFEQEDSPRGEAARTIHFTELSFAQMIADHRIMHLTQAGDRRGIYLRDSLDGRFIPFMEDREWSVWNVPQTYEGAQRFARPFIKPVRDVLERGALNMTLPEYSLPDIISPESDLFVNLATIFLGDRNNTAFVEFRRARANYINAPYAGLEDYQSSLWGLRQELYEKVVELFSLVDERIHPTVERKLKRLAVFAITGGVSSKLYSAAQAHENPYHAIDSMKHPLADLKPYLNQIAVEHGLTPPHLRRG